MKVTCPSCQTIYQIDDSKIPDQGIYGRCPKCQQRFLVRILITKQTLQQEARDYMKTYVEAQPKAKRPDVEKAVKKEENKKDPPPQYKYAKVDAVMLLVQCLIVAVIGMICWLAFRKDEASESFKKKFVEQKKGETRVPPPTEDLKETPVSDASSTPPHRRK